MIQANTKFEQSSWYFNCKFGDFVDCTNPIDLEIKDTTDTAKSASYSDLHLEIYNEVG